MATTEQFLTGSGTSYEFNIDRIKDSDIKVKVNDSDLEYTTDTPVPSGKYKVSGTTITLGTAATAIHVYRETELADGDSVSYVPGSSIRAKDLNANHKLVRFASQEQNQLITNATVANTAEIAVSKLADGTARQLLQTDSAGTGVEWTSNVDIPGTLDVTGNTTFDGSILLKSGGNASFLGAATFYGDTTIGNSSSDTVTIGAKLGSNLIPNSTSIDLGASSTRFGDIFGTTLDVTGTSSLAGLNVNGNIDISNGEIKLGNADEFSIKYDETLDSAVFNADRIRFYSDNDSFNFYFGDINDAAADVLAFSVFGSGIQVSKLIYPDVTNTIDLGYNDANKKFRNIYAAGTGEFGNISGDAVVTSGTSTSDTKVYSAKRTEELFFNTTTGETIKDGDTFPDNDTTIATTAAINDRIIDLIDDVGGFVPLASEADFPAANPDVNNGAGTIVSVGVLSATYTPSGNGQVIIPDSTLTNISGSNVIITDCGTTVLSAGYGLLVETTSILHAYKFHRLTPKATEVTTVAGNVTNVNIVAGNNNNVSAVGGAIVNVNTVAGQISPTNNIATVVSNATNISTVATNINSVNDFADKYRIASSAPTSNNDTGDLYYNTGDNKLYIYNGSSWDVATELNATGGTVQGDTTFTDSTKLQLGTHLDLKLFHNGSKNIIQSNASTNTEILSDVFFIKNTSEEELIRAGTEVKLYYGGDSTAKLETTATGVLVTELTNSGNTTFNGSYVTFSGTNTAAWDKANTRLLFNDNAKAAFGTGADLQLYHENSGNNGMIFNKTGDLYIQGNDGSDAAQTAIQIHSNGAVDLKYAGAGPKLSTTASGATVTGKLDVTGGTGGGGHQNLLELKHTNTNTSGDGPVLLFNGYYDNSNAGVSNEWAFAKIAAENRGSGYGSNLKFYVHPADNDQTSSVVEALTITGNGTGADATFAGDITVSNTKPTITLNDTDSESDYWIQNDDGVFAIKDLDTSGGIGRMTIAPNGVTTFSGNCDFSSGIDVTGASTFAGNVSISGAAGILEIAANTCLIDLMETSTTNHRIRNGNGNFYIQKISDDKNTTDTQLLIDGGTGAVQLYHDGSTDPKLKTESWGVTVDGNLEGMTTVSSGEFKISGTTVLNSSKSLYNIGTFACSGPATITGTEGVSASLYLIADEGDDDGDGWRINSNQDDNDLTISNNESGSYVDKITVNKGGEVGIGFQPTANGGYCQIQNNKAYTDGASDLLTSGSKASFRIKSGNNTSKSLFIGGVDGNAEPYLQVGNLATDGPTAAYDLHFNKYGGDVKLYSGGATDPMLQTTSTGIKVSGADSGDQIKIVASGTNANGVIDFESPGTGGGIIKTQGTTALTLDNSQNATFAGNVFVTAAGANRLSMGHSSGGNFVIKNPTAATLSFGTDNNDDELTIANGGNTTIKEHLYVKGGGTDPKFQTTSNGIKIGSGSGAAASTYYDDIVIDNSGTASGASGGTGVTLVSGNDTWGSFSFSDSDADQQGAVKYNHTDDLMQFRVNGSTVLELDSSRNATFSGGSDAKVTIYAPNHDSGSTQQVQLEFKYNQSHANDSVGYIKLVEGSTNHFGGHLSFGVPYDNSGTPATRDDVLKLNHDNSATFAGSVYVSSDSNKIYAGTDNEMQVFHDGTDSIIKDTRTSGSIKAQADNFIVKNKDNDQTFLSGINNGSTKLFFGGASDPMLYTTPFGVSISGDLTVEQTQNSAVDLVIKNNNNTQNGATAKLTIEAGDAANVGGIIRLEQNGAYHELESDKDGNFTLSDNGTSVLTLDSSQNATFAGDVTINGGASTQLTLKGTEADLWLTSTGSGSNKSWRILGSTGGNTHKFRIYDHTNDRDAFTIANDGNATLSHNAIFNAGYGCHFGAATGSGSTSTVLDDYEEGNHNPTDESGQSLSFTNNNTGIYTKIGAFVYFSFDITYPTTTNGDDAKITAPYMASQNNHGGGCVGYTSLDKTVLLHINTGGVFLRDEGGSNLTNAQCSGKRFIGQLTFRAA